MAEKFRAMEGLYNDWNAKINVISRKDIGSLYVRHVLHSLAFAGYLKEARPEIFEEWTRGTGISVLDLG
ncbi:MAG: class I SAM-dependent methyltransferase, partial [Bacteroides sp.]|nr:class I SAM-dependent methyltransferase [Bacteroides sp.]